MASSNRHWPSMFKSKPCNTTHLQWQQHHLTAGYHRTPYTAVPECEERTVEPKPRWNPRPEQIRILEAIFNSGMVNPPRDEIRKIRAQLQEYGQVGDANVFYWFQNRKSRSKHKQRQLSNITKSQPQTTIPSPPISDVITTAVTVPASSSSSSDKTSPDRSAEKALSVGSTPVIDLLSSSTALVNQSFLQAPRELLGDHFFFPVHQNNGGSTAAPGLTQGFCFPDLSTVIDQGIGSCPSFQLSELMLMNNSVLKKAEDDKIRLQQEINPTIVTAPDSTVPAICTPSFSITSPADRILQEEMVQTKSTVFVNDVCLEVGSGPFNVREAFGNDAVLVQLSGQPVITNEWGVTVQPLHHGDFYHLLRAFTPDENRNIHLI
ncbi:WUSCHEL-related homeobox 9-like isoform X1 [Primulina tabacum]|uniref:WUSCHEL-related homeobox 9-like isoform X1 n=1 Tax=Primulina tabacum TaxID=48773 RepID=UPI003F5ABCBE